MTGVAPQGPEQERQRHILMRQATWPRAEDLILGIQTFLMWIPGVQAPGTQGDSGVVEVVLRGWTSLVTLRPRLPLTTIFSTSRQCACSVS